MDRQTWLSKIRALGPANVVSDATDERLTMLGEEASEVIKACAKFKRGGPLYKPHDGPKTNKELLEDEIRDFLAVVEIMNRAGDIDPIEISEDDINRRLKFTHYQGL